jgi:hypothetical protein
MKKGLSKLLVSILLLTTLASLLFVPSTQALNSSYSDYTMSYLTVSSSADVVKPGNTLTVSIIAKLSDVINGSDVLHIQIFADTVSKPSTILSESDLVLSPGPNATEKSAQYAVSVPSDIIPNTYIYATINDTTHVYSRIALSLVQPSTYSELQAQIHQLQSQNEDLQSTNNTNILLLYIALAVAALFIVTTVYILSLTFRAKKKQATTLPT